MTSSTALYDRLLLFQKMAGIAKKTTNLTGLTVCHNPQYVLNRLYKRILGILQQMPENSSYKKYTENVIKERSLIVNTSPDVKSIEEKISCGQVEELITQAQNELSLAENMLIARPWENLIAPIPKNQWKWPMK